MVVVRKAFYTKAIIVFGDGFGSVFECRCYEFFRSWLIKSTKKVLLGCSLELPWLKFHKSELFRPRLKSSWPRISVRRDKRGRQVGQGRRGYSSPFQPLQTLFPFISGAVFMHAGLPIRYIFPSISKEFLAPAQRAAQQEQQAGRAGAAGAAREGV